MRESIRNDVWRKLFWLWLSLAIGSGAVIAFVERNGQPLKALLEVEAAILVTVVAVYPLMLFCNKALIDHLQELVSANIELLEVIGAAIAQRDSETSLHNYRVAIYAIHLAEAIGLPPLKIAELIKGVFLHDIGTILFSDELLLKPGKLTPDEFEIVKTHTIKGSELIRKTSWLTEADEVIRFHHEKYGGTGYMENLAGKYIPLNARIFSIVDVFDILTSKRPYREAYTFNKAMRILDEGSGTQFDPELLTCFHKIAKSLYDSVVDINEEEAREQLRGLLKQYF
ncbi:MAG TPA: HD domain-containing protein [Methylomusa anaerophila]|uniref:Cyclic di-GMP phosphodiesterase response regulator RpfG n=1 Tax=Methylomusa anaerophila TaxID=1930071 RepID=A0A348AI29_9FIRM|nr:HD domain-containing phosphohydrolase [Methylomusa anaerophila]BBB90727.1 cyclic di-GMP phosphodiesterase response regulator RpfG [Methylomusa anaerophila]HML88670.1 HD domain-containing protein [Methylomusa anaerophila]